MASQTDGNTVFFTEQEAERIRNTVRDRLKRCSELAGRAREPAGDAQSAISEANGASLLAEMSLMGGLAGKRQDDKLPALGVGQVYAPSIVPLRELQPMKLADLQMDTHHRGRRLTVKRVSLVVTHAARSWTVVQDVGGEETERLEMYLHKMKHGKEVLESASTFVIKEPYFTLSDQGQATLRIDHPSDLIVCRDGMGSNQVNGHVGEATDIDAAAAEKLAVTRKDEGNAALRKQDLGLAHAKYTHGLKIARQALVAKSNPDLARDISRNRALVNLLLNRLDEAKADAKSSLLGRNDEKSRELDSKAYSRAGTAAYNLGEYQEAKSMFDEQLKLTPDDKNASINLRRVTMRLREQETGVYNLDKIRVSLSRARPGADAATFLGSTEVRDSPGRGRGLFATRDIAPGDIIVCEKAFCVAWGHEGEALAAMTYDLRDNRIRLSPVGLTRMLVQKLLDNTSQVERVMNLYGDYQGDSKGVLETGDGPVIDTFRLHDIMSRNAFSLGSGLYGADNGPSGTSTGLWVWAAYINHSCVPNAAREFVGDLMVIRALQPIGAGQEIFHSYHTSSDYDERQAALMDTWGFECSDCALCKAERADDPAIRRKRRELAREADAFVEQVHWVGAKRLTIAKAQRLARAIEETYDEKRYENVPHVAVERIQGWLAKATARR